MIEDYKQKIREKLNTYQSVLDKMSLDQARHLFLTARTLIWIAPGVIWFICLWQILLPLGTLNFEIFTLFCWLILALSAVSSCFVNWSLMMLTTRRKDKNQDERVELMWNQLQIGFWQLSYIVGASLALPISLTAIPFLQYLRLHPEQGVTLQMVDQATGNPLIMRLLLAGIAVIWALYVHSRFVHLSLLFEQRIKRWMTNYEFHYRPLHTMLADEEYADPEKVKHLPMMVLGTSLETGDLVVQTPETRRRNSIVIGPIGAGKTSAWFRPQIDQDIDHYLAYIRDYSKVSKDPDWNKPYGEQQNYLNGFAVVEPTDDLCKTIFDDCIAKGVPRDKIVWLDPENPDTPSLNLMSGPVDSVSSNLTDIFTGLKESANDFFSQAERAYLEQHIYLLNFAGVIEGNNAGFDELMNMFNDVYIVVKKVTELKAYVEILRINTVAAKKLYEQRPDSKTIFSKYKELRDYYDIAYETLQWFQTNIYTENYKTGVKVQQSGPYKGWPVYVNRQEQFVQGLMNTLSDISKKIGLRRVLFRKTKNFNLDDFMKNGGILLCNTGKKKLGAVLAKILGQIYTLSLESATFRRNPNIDPMFALYMDEFPDYLSESFPDFAAQARKFNVPINLACQSISQLSRVFGSDYMKTVTSVMLTRATFGDLGPDDARALEPMFGEHEEATESINEQDIDLAADQAQNRRKIQTRVEKVPNISAAEIMGLENHTMAIRTPGEHKSDVFNRIKVERITDTAIKNDPNNFNMDDPNDCKAYEEMIKTDQHLNPDYTPIDLQISDQLKKKEYVIQWPSEADMKEVVNTDPTILDSEGNVVVGGEEDDDSLDRHSILPSGAESSTSVLTTKEKFEKEHGKSTVKKVIHSQQNITTNNENTPVGMHIDEEMPNSEDLQGNYDILDDPFVNFGGDVSNQFTRVGGKKEDSNSGSDDLASEDFSALLSDKPPIGNNESTRDSENEVLDTHFSSDDENAVDSKKKAKNFIDESDDEAKEALSKSVFKSPNKGNGRNDNDLKVDDKEPKLADSHINSQPRIIPKILKKNQVCKTDIHPNINKESVNDNKNKFAENFSDTGEKVADSAMINKKEKEKDTVLVINDNNQIVDKKISNQHPITPERDKMQRGLKRHALITMQQSFTQIANDPSLTEIERLNAMKDFRTKERKILSSIFPNSIDKVIDRITQAINKQEAKVKETHNTLNGSDNYQTITRKIDETREAHHEELNKDLEEMMKKFNNQPDTIESNEEIADGDDNEDDFEVDHTMNDEDPWISQPGMLNEKDYLDPDLNNDEE